MQGGRLTRRGRSTAPPSISLSNEMVGGSRTGLGSAPLARGYFRSFLLLFGLVVRLQYRPVPTQGY